MLSPQDKMHEKAAEHLKALESLIDQLGIAGPDLNHRWHALQDTKERLLALSERCGSRLGGE